MSKKPKAKTARTYRGVKVPTHTPGDAPLFLDAPAVAIRYGIARETVVRWESTGRLPPSIKFGHRTTRWRLADLLKFEQEAAERSVA